MASSYNQYDDQGSSGMKQASGGMGILLWAGADFALDYAYSKIRKNLQNPTGFAGMNKGLVKGMEKSKQAGWLNWKNDYRKMRGQAPINTKGRTDKFLNNYYDSKVEHEVFNDSFKLKEGEEVAKTLTRSEFMGAARSAYTKTQVMKKFYKLAQFSQTMWLAPMLFGATYHGFKGMQKLGMNLGRPELGGHLTFTALAATDRMRSMQALANSEFSARRSLGNEAAMYS
jgi:hypothetical protein